MTDSESKVILIHRRTRLENLIAKYNTVEQARFYLEHLGANFDDYQHEHITYRKVIARAESELRTLARVQTVEREFLPNFIFGPKDIVVAIGQDGLVANTVKYLSGQALIGINPDPKRWDGVLLPFEANDIVSVTRDVIADRRPMKNVTLAKAELNNGQQLYAVNDFFIGPKSHASARYEIQLGNQREFQSSSGIIVSTGLGSTGWLQSLIAGAEGVAGSSMSSELAKKVKGGFEWDAEYLMYTVREPFPSKTTGATLVFGNVTQSVPLNVTSLMPENGVIFSDGMEADFLEFHSGTRVVITIAEKRGRLAV